MSAELERVHCQRCLAINLTDREFCLRCGTPLMLVNVSATHHFEDQLTPEPHGEHLLERISSLELRLARVTRIAEQALELASRQSLAIDLAAHVSPVASPVRATPKKKASERGKRPAIKAAKVARKGT